MDKRGIVDNDLIPLLLQVRDDAIRDISLLTFDKQHPQHLYAICLYATILEIAYESLLLVEKRRFITLPTLMRSLLEAYADFLNTLEKPEYFKNMYASFLKQKLDLVRKAKKNPDNPYLKDVVESVDLKQAQTNLESEIERLKNSGHSPLNVAERFSKAGLSNEYQSVYWLLCLNTHNNVYDLENRHIEKTGDDYAVALFKENSPDDLIRYFDTLAATLIDSSIRIYDFLATKTSHRFDRHLKALNAIRSNYR